MWSNCLQSAAVQDENNIHTYIIYLDSLLDIMIGYASWLEATLLTHLLTLYSPKPQQYVRLFANDANDNDINAHKSYRSKTHLLKVKSYLLLKEVILTSVSVSSTWYSNVVPSYVAFDKYMCSLVTTFFNIYIWKCV